MVHLLIERYGQAQSGVRATNDIDVLANTRVRPSVTQRIATKLRNLGFEIPHPTGIDSNTAYRFVRGDEIVDVPRGRGCRRPGQDRRKPDGWAGSFASDRATLDTVAGGVDVHMRPPVRLPTPSSVSGPS